MCTHCACSDSNAVTMTNLQTGGHVHLEWSDSDDVRHERAATVMAAAPAAPAGQRVDVEEPVASHTLRVEQSLLGKNAALAERNRGWFAGRGVLALNIMSSPGAGKTTLLERTLQTLGREMVFHVIEGDQATVRDAERIRASGGKAVQVNTGTGCHLDAAMVAAALRQLEPPAGAVVLIENVGNLVCPALFDLGEHARVIVASVAEGDDKPLKYPHMFRAADVIVLNKIDLCPHVEFDVAAFLERTRELNPRARVIQVSATRGTGVDEWQNWLLERWRARAQSN